MTGGGLGITAAEFAARQAIAAEVRAELDADRLDDSFRAAFEPDPADPMPGHNVPGTCPTCGDVLDEDE